MPLLGAHMSIAGGLYKAVDAAAHFGMDTVQIFTHSPSQWPFAGKTRPGKGVQSGRSLTKNNNQWRAKPLSGEDVERFEEALERTGVRRPCAHDSYLINLGSPKDDLWQKSLDAFVVELERAEALGLEGVVAHPGSFVESTEQEGLDRIVKGLDETLDRTAGKSVEIWLETTAGQGTNLGHRFEHLGYIVENVQDADRIGVCIDTCHVFAAGYPIQERKDYLATMREFDRVVGLERVRAFHLNDSKKPFGSRVDRHEHIGQGEIGLSAFEHVVNDRRFAKLPMYMETPKKETDEGEHWDGVNLRTLRSLVKKRGSTKGR